MRSDSRSFAEAAFVKLRAGQFDERTGSPLRQTSGVLNAFAAHERRQGGVHDCRTLVRQPPGNAHPRPFFREDHVLFLRLGFLGLDSERRAVPISARLDAPLELPRGALPRPSDKLLLNGVGERVFQLGRRQEATNDIDVPRENLAVLQGLRHPAQPRIKGLGPFDFLDSRARGLP